MSPMNGDEVIAGRGITEASGGVATLTRKDFVSDQEVRWCPGCGDYAILAAVQTVLPELGVPREKIVFISGIGCASRLPYYMNTYGLHGIHGRAPAIATGLATARPDLQVWVVMGDGDALSIGGNHLIHALRRNVNLKLLMFNNQIYGLTKGQYSPTSEQGKVTKSTPFGSLERPFNPISVALGAEATFVARTMDIERRHLPAILRRAARHRGSAFVEIYQNCNIFNDGAFLALASKEGGSKNRIYLEHGKPIRFGADLERGVCMDKDGRLEIVDVSRVGEDALVTHDEQRDDPSLAFALSRIADGPTSPTPFGVFRDIEQPVYGETMEHQLHRAADQQGPGDLERLLFSGDTWSVE
jgi:2-oxoglutarate/2-oxoacid ferredoxin oxidoreductase subunit beta